MFLQGIPWALSEKLGGYSGLCRALGWSREGHRRVGKAGVNSYMGTSGVVIHAHILSSISCPAKPRQREAGGGGLGLPALGHGLVVLARTQVVLLSQESYWSQKVTFSSSPKRSSLWP